MLDKRFFVVLKLFTCRGKFAASFFGRIDMTRSSLHTPRTFPTLTAAILMLPGKGWNTFACASLEIGNYQPKRRDLDRTEQLD